MNIRIPDNTTDYYNFPLCLKKDAKVESVHVTSMNTNLGSSTSHYSSSKRKDNSGFEEILNTEIKKYR